MQFFFEVAINGLLSGLMYSLVALGFVLIYKASGVFNFAQGAMVYFAALAVVGLIDLGLPLWAAIIGAFCVMLVMGLATERFVLDVNDEFGTTVVLIEHDMGVVMDISDRVVVLDYGKKIGDGTPDEVRNNPEVIRAYLGTEH